MAPDDAAALGPEGLGGLNEWLTLYSQHFRPHQPAGAKPSGGAYDQHERDDGELVPHGH